MENGGGEEVVAMVDAEARPVRLALRGAVTSYHADALHAACLAAAELGAAIDVDLTAARFVGTAAIQILLALAHDIARRGHQLRLVNVGAELAALLGPIGVLSLLEAPPPTTGAAS